MQRRHQKLLLSIFGLVEGELTVRGRVIPGAQAILRIGEPKQRDHEAVDWTVATAKGGNGGSEVMSSPDRIARPEPQDSASNEAVGYFGTQARRFGRQRLAQRKPL
jgi:hypothetical protein